MYRFLLFTAIALAIPFTAFSQSYEALIDSADNYSRLERWNDAARCYRESLRINPASPLNSKLFANLGICLTRLGDYSGAIQAFDIALVKEPESAKILSSRASAHLLAGNDSLALADLDRAIMADSTSASPRRMHGQLMLVAQNVDRAEQDFIVLSKYDPADPWGPAGLGEVYSARDDHQKAIAMFTKAIELEDNADFRISLISSMLACNKLADAEDTIRQSLAIYPRTGEFYLLRALLHKTLHQNHDAEIDKKVAIEYGVDPQTVEKYLPEIAK